MKDTIIDKCAIAMRRRGETIFSLAEKTGLAYNTVSKIVKKGSGNTESIEKIFKQLEIQIS